MISRRTLIKGGLLGTAAFALSPWPGLHAAPAGYGITGRTAPELDVDYWIDAEGVSTPGFKLADQAGKWVMLKCWQSWCPGCHKLGFPALKSISEHFADAEGIAFAGIQTVFEGHYTNTRDKVRKTQLQYDLRMPMGHDPGLEDGRPQTMIDYRTGGTPWIVLIDPERRVVFNDFHINVERAIEFLEQELA